LLVPVINQNPVRFDGTLNIFNDKDKEQHWSGALRKGISDSCSKPLHSAVHGYILASVCTLMLD